MSEPSAGQRIEAVIRAVRDATEELEVALSQPRGPRGLLAVALLPPEREIQLLAALPEHARRGPARAAPIVMPDELV